MKHGRKWLLELGPGESPVAFRHRNKKKILIDKHRGMLVKLKQRHGRVPGAFAEAEALPFKPGTISHVEARMFPPVYPGHCGDKVNDAVKELARVIKKGGIATITAERTAWANIRENFQKAGFKLMKERLLGKSRKLTVWEKDYVPHPGVRLFKFKKL